MKTFLLSLLLSFSAHAITTIQFLPGNQQGMVMLLATAPSGQTDHDFLDMWNFMNVPEQDSFVGKGKSITAGQSPQDFSLVCGMSYSQCQVVLSKSPRVRMDASAGAMSFVADGPTADVLIQKFHLGSDGQLQFLSSDHKFRLLGSEGHFEFDASTNGF